MTTRFLIVATTALFAVIGSPPVQAQPPGAQGADKWEYGVLEYRHQAGKKADSGEIRYPVSWLTAAGEVREYGWEAVAEKLKVPAPTGDAPVTDKVAFLKLRVLNHLGSQGWELVSFDQGGGNAYLWTFKRKAAK